MHARIEKLIAGGVGLVRDPELGVLFVPYGLPGQEVELEIEKKAKTFSWAKITKVIKEAPGARAAPCPFFRQCGGCAIQHLEYAKQLEVKRLLVADALEHTGNLNLEPEETLPSPLEYGYRNKIDFSFGYRREGLKIGFRPKDNFRNTLEIEHCLLFDERQAKLWQAVRRLIAAAPFKQTQELERDFLQYLTIRKSFSSNKFLVVLVTQNGEINRAAWLKAVSESLGEDLAGFVWKRNLRKSQRKQMPECLTLCGQDYLMEKVGPLNFRVSALSFFQTNSLGAEVLYNEVQSAAKLSGREIILDLYCGTGTIGQYLAHQAQAVYGAELNPAAIEDAKLNAELNKLKNCHYQASAVEEFLNALPDKAGQAAVVVIDPPRAGLSQGLHQRLALLPKLERIVYVSCDPVTLARDCQLFAQVDFHLKRVQPVDMFPHTAHIENVAILSRQKD